MVLILVLGICQLGEYSGYIYKDIDDINLDFFAVTNLCIMLIPILRI